MSPYSSSKTSNPPSDEPRAIAAASETPAAKDGAPVVKEEVGKRPAPRLSRRKSKDASIETVERAKDEALFNLPSVPSTHHLHPHDVHVASFFSIHRPISVTASIPPSSTSSAFSSIFVPRKPQPAEVIHTLSSAVKTLENASSRNALGPPQPAQAHQTTTEEMDERAAVTQASSSNAEPAKHLDGAHGQPLQLNLEELLKNFRPFVPPPPPSPMGSLDVAELQDAEQATGQPAESEQVTTKQKSYSTVLTLIESTHPNGRKSYKVRTSPFQETRNLPPSSSSQGKLIELPTSSVKVPSQKFLKRMRERQEKWEDFRDEQIRDNETGGWQTISVKRQKKLKMKKHKYKKLMRRTRNLRKKLDRL
ncbi:MAG: hypothetical protein FRX48_09366 [Lasallia pustulata]|uniref:Small ribosomal subunit protein mS38 n=1 Tax=Lasallia pustulata TaxID=136370 RepID=A0A5M8PD64_9LECA|nr:MAG: hypothetical protein FRX48_09366 [Lasallia pustulata]